MARNRKRQMGIDGPRYPAPALGHNGGPVLEHHAHVHAIANETQRRACIDCKAEISAFGSGRCKRCAYRAKSRPVPPDFLEQLARRGSGGCAVHYRASLTTITKWRRASGLRPQLRMRRSPSMGGGFKRQTGTLARIMIHRDHSDAGQAADFLRRFGAVYRCDEGGKPNSKGAFWNRNNHVLDDGEIMFRAKRLGWSPVRVF